MKSAKTKNKPSTKSKEFQTSRSQQKITQFFQKPSTSQPNILGSSTPQTSPARHKYNTKNYGPNLRTGSATIATPVAIRPKSGEDDEVIIISDESEEETSSDITKVQICTLNFERTSCGGGESNNECKPQTSHFEISVEDAKAKQLMPTEPNKTPNPGDPYNSLGGSSDSEDEILSQLDIDEIISSQENASQTKAHESRRSQGEPLTPTLPENIVPKVVNKLPLKSPKAKVNYYSPLSKLNSHSPAKSNTGSKSSSKKTPSSQERPNPLSFSSKPQIVKKLEFPDLPIEFVPYYLKNFTSVLDSVTSDAMNTHLLNASDMSIIQKFRNTTTNAKLLFVRLFLRKWEWKIASSIKYPKIKDDLTPLFEELHSSALLVEIRDVINELELESVLEILSADQILALAKLMNVALKKKTKGESKLALLALTKTKPIFSTTSSINDIIKKKALELSGVTYQVEGTCRAIFSRIFILHSPPQYWDDEQDQSSNQLLKMMMADDGKMLYPQCPINKKTIIYQERDDLISFHDAWTTHCSITAYTESKDWEEVVKLGEHAFSLLKQNLDDVLILSTDERLPSFLRVYKAGSVLTRVVWLAVEGYQKLKKYQLATQHLNFLLTQDLYLTQYRGRWFERLAINQKHLKVSFELRKLTLENALKDKFLLDSHKLCISERLDKLMEEIQRPPKKKTKTSVEQDGILDNGAILLQTSVELFRLCRTLPTRTITGEKLLNPNSGKSVFISQKDDFGSSDASSVEMFAISHYQKYEGYTNGLHAEGAVVTSLFGLLFWDAIYNGEISDTFHSQYQVLPLDMTFDEFFIQRQGIILDQLQGMRCSWSIEDAVEILERNWNQHENVLSLVNWSVFPNVELAKSLLRRIGLSVMADISERLARNFRHWRSGFPDLVLWNNKDVLFAEIKGPGDSLSYKQKVWLEFLLSIGAKAEVCHVQAVSNKKIRT